MICELITSCSCQTAGYSENEISARVCLGWSWSTGFVNVVADASETDAFAIAVGHIVFLRYVEITFAG